MRAVRPGPAIGLLAEIALLALLAATVGLSAAGWLVGIACGITTNGLVARGLAAGATALNLPDRVTLVRATLVGGVAALVTTSFDHDGSLAALVSLAVLALVLDAVDGWLARRLRAVTEFGARFDMEVDAFLIFVLSVLVARSTGAWVLAIGFARYAFVVAGRLWPWLREAVPARYWRKTVAAIQGIVLTTAAADVLPAPLIELALTVALVLLAESFGRDLWWLWRCHRTGDVTAPITGRGSFASGFAFLLVWFALVFPNRWDELTPASLLRVPLEGLVLVAVGLVLPSRVRRIVGALVGLVLGLLTLVKIVDFGFFAALDRPFDPVNDWSYFGPAFGVARDSVGRGWAVAAVVGLVLLGVAVLVLVPLAVMRVTRLAAQHRSGSARAIGAFAMVWVVCAALGVHLESGQPIASTSAAGLAYDQVQEVRTAIHDRQAFATELAADDRFADVGRGSLLSGLRGKDVIIAFVESYGRVAVQDSAFSPQVDAVLNAGTEQLRAAGFASQSAFLTSPTFGGISWLAHSTLQSGLWIDNQQRYDDLVASDRFTLSDAFRRAGWRTVGDVPSNGVSWPEGSSFYHYRKLYNLANVGYAGPRFSYATMPDQYVLSAFQRLELARTARRPVMAEIDLVSSHTPWAPLPRLVDWNAVGDGSVFDGMPEQGDSPDAVWRDADHVRAAYGQSVAYSLSALISFVQTYPDPNLVLVVLGDHQPATVVTGSGASHDVPITVIAHDPAVMDRISPWGWQDGMLPGPQAPVWPMDTFRDRFLTAFGPAGG